MNINAVNSWIGKTIQDQDLEGVITKFMGGGNTHIVFGVSCSGKNMVIKFPKSHIGFVIFLPPGRLFPEIQKDTANEDRLVARLTSLQGSSNLSTIFPLENLWTSLAVGHLRSHEKRHQTIVAEDYSKLFYCDFVLERLMDWANINNTGFDPIIIYEHEKPIHGDFPKKLAKEASEAIARFEKPKHMISNPFLPWFAAACSGYLIPATACDVLRESLANNPEYDSIIEEAHQVLRYSGIHVGWSERKAMIDLLFGVTK